MDNETKEKAAAIAGEAKKKAVGIWSKCIGKIGALWKSGVTGKVICIAGALVVFGLIAVCIDGEENGGSGGGGGKKFEVNAPVKSLCGFSIGATPDSVKHLFKPGWNREDNASIARDLAKPFRYFTRANATFQKNPVTGDGLYLTHVRLLSPLCDAGGTAVYNWTKRDFSEECKTIVAMLEKKYGIKFQEEGNEWVWTTGEGDDLARQSIKLEFHACFMELSFTSALYSARDEAALRKKQKQSSKLSAGAGADQL